MTRTALLIAAVLAAAACLVIGVRLGREAPRVDRDAWPEGVGTW